MDLTIASYNMHGGVGTDGRFDLHRTGEVLREIGADLIALQECGDFRARARPGDTGDHPERLAQMLGLHMAFGPNVVRGNRRFGNAVLSRLPIRRTHNYDLTVRGRQSRGALLCDLDQGGTTPLHLFCLHLGLTAGERREQEVMLLSAEILRDAARREPVVICGDFNYWWSGPVPALVRHSIHDAALEVGQPGRTYPSRLPLFRLDRFFTAGAVQPLEVRVHRSELASRASDHLPVVMRFATLAPGAIEHHPVQLIG
ncbi:MAG: endonuclease/exonuclease/phosphatase family protein [Myxococcaceae bacterium]